MKRMPVFLAAVSAWISAAQAADLPKELNGRWTWAAKNATQTFALEDIKAQGQESFTALLTWWTMDPKCALRGVPITGKVMAAGLSFDATTKCDVSFTADLNRSDKGWTGVAKINGASGVVIDLKAD